MESLGVMNQGVHPSQSHLISANGFQGGPVQHGLTPVLADMAAAATTVQMQQHSTPNHHSGEMGMGGANMPGTQTQQDFTRNSTTATTPSVEIKLFVGRVPRSFTEEQLRPIFEEYARVLEVAIIRDKSTQVHKGSAFVRLASITEADRAIRALNDTKILDPTLGPLQVRYAQGETEKLGLTSEGSTQGHDQAKLFVGSLPKGITEEEVHKLFSVFGPIDEIFLLKDNATNACKGCAFVKFTYKEQAMNAIRNYNGLLHLANAPRPLEVRFAETKKNPHQATQVHSPIPTTTIRGMQNTPPSNNNPRSAGSWKEYFTSDHTPYYHNEVTNVTQWERPPEFDQLHMSGAPLGRSDVTGPPGANIFVFHIPNDWSTYDLHQNFGHFGNILSAHIPTDKATNRNKGYAFVSFDCINSAVAAVTCMNGFLANGKRLKVSIKQHEDKYVAHLMPQTTTPANQPIGGQMAMPSPMAGAQNMRPVMAAAGMPAMQQQSSTLPHLAGMSPPAASLVPVQHYQMSAGAAGYGGYPYNTMAPAANQTRYTPY